MSQRKTKALTCLHANQRKEQLFNLFDAKHGKGNRGGKEPQLSWKILSRALFVNSCSIEVDIMIREPLHTKFHKKKLCAWYMNASSIMTHLSICTSPNTPISKGMYDICECQYAKGRVNSQHGKRKNLQILRKLWGHSHKTSYQHYCKPSIGKMKKLLQLSSGFFGLIRVCPDYPGTIRQ